jgi:hypothetical protein
MILAMSHTVAPHNADSASMLRVNYYPIRVTGAFPTTQRHYDHQRQPTVNFFCELTGYHNRRMRKSVAAMHIKKFL